ncbi:hypothetical protein [Conexibacter sp. SYSU D00693]|uniref:hypothetical protein n=1 Tax=Conexibacter sp. SYSU D00693 TaxID=2812560 RepID=UPI00196AF13F|nr:hypothetical protein [Conexibacter sp. SYSU D00693]
MSPSGIYASTANRRQRTWLRRRRRLVVLARSRAGLLLAWAPAPVLAVLVAQQYLG